MYSNLARIIPTPRGGAHEDIAIVDDLHSFDRRIPSLVLLDEGADAFEAIAAGARGAISRTSSASRIDAALRAIGEGLIVIDRGPIREVDPLTDPLTAREQDVLRLLANGLTNKEIATRLGITDHTVKFHVNAILAKLGAETRTEAVVHAAKLGIVVL